jgi:signal transduction histidine kinase
MTAVPTAVPADKAAADSRRLLQVLEQLLTDCASSSGGTEGTRRVLAASMTALEASAVRLVAEDGQVLADWRAPGASAGGVTMSAGLADGSRLTVAWDGPPSVTDDQLQVVARLVGMVEEVTATHRHATLRLRQQRQAWGQEIHDGVTQSVTAAVMMLERVKTVSASVSPALVEDAQEEIRASLRELREVLAEVVDQEAVDRETAEVTDDGHSLAQLVDDIRARWRLRARVVVRGELSGMAEDVAGVARSVVREALINVAKHADATHVSISANHEVGEVRVQVTDNGIGISDDLAWTRSNLRMGLRLMEQRVALVGGSLEVKTDAGKGTTVTVVLPRSGR